MGCKRGFALLTPAMRREMARLGGQMAHAQGVAHEWNIDEAREAGRRGGTRKAKNRGRRELNAACSRSSS